MKALVSFDSFLHSLVPFNHRLMESVIDGFHILFEEMRLQAPKSIESWLADSVVKQPVFHATGRSFDKFDSNKTNPESYFGRGIYFSSSVDDVRVNYANKKGGDVKIRIEQVIERLTESGFEDDSGAIEYLTEYLKLEFPDYTPDQVDAYIAKLGNRYQDGIPKTTATKIANRIYAKAFRTIPAFIKLTNPLKVMRNGDYFDITTSIDYNPEDEDQLTAMRDEGYDDYESYYSDRMNEFEPTGKLVDFIESMRYVADGSDYDAVDECMNNLYERFYEGGKVSDILTFVKANAYTDNTSIHELINQAIRRMGYDGIIMEPDPKWNMKHTSGTLHYIVFDPKNIRSAFTGGEL